MNHQIVELPSLIKTLCEKLASNNGEGNGRNVLATATTNRSGTLYALKHDDFPVGLILHEKMNSSY